MTATQTMTETDFAELVEQSFSTFCQETGAMFDWEMESEQTEVCVETVKGLKKRFKKYIAVYTVQSDGILNGTFQVLFDHEGLFTLGGMIVMLPGTRILEIRKHGAAKEAGEISDAVKEAGNMLIGSLDKVFREDLEGHGHLLHTDTFIGEPWNKSDEKVGMRADEEFLFVACEMTIESYPAFQCGVTFPKKLYAHMVESGSEQSVAKAPKPQVETEQQERTAKTEEGDSTSDVKAEAKPDAEPPAAKEPETTVEAASQEPTAETEEAHPASDEKTDTEPNAAPPAVEEAKTPVEAEQQNETAENDNTQSKPEEKAEVVNKDEEPEAKAVSPPVENAPVAMEEQPAQAHATGTKHELSNNTIGALSNLPVRDVMQKNVLWCNPEEGMGEVLAKMCQGGMNYALIGPEGTLEGVVSMSDLRAGMSPYLRPEFNKWRRPIDDASLRIKVGLLMSRNIQTVQSQDRLSDVAARMCRLGLHSMPVVNQEGSVEGLVNVFDVLRSLSHTNMEAASKN